MQKQFLFWIGVLGLLLAPHVIAHDQFVVTATSEEAEQKLEQAANLEKSKKWEEACLLYQNIMEEYGETVVPTSNNLYSSTYEVCLRRLRELPSEGKKVYQSLVEVKAQQLFEDEQNRLENLSEISSRYLYSEVGPEALLNLIDSFLYREKYQRAIPQIKKYLKYEMGDLRTRLGVWARLVFCYYAIGNKEGIEEILQHPIAKQTTSITIGNQQTTLKEFAKEYKSKVQERLAGLNLDAKWPMLGKDSQHSFSSHQGLPIFTLSWSANLPQAERVEQDEMYYYNEPRRVVEGPPSFYPTVADNTIYINNGKDIVAYNLLSKDEKWRYRGLVSEVRSEIHEQVIHSVAYHNGAIYANVEGPTTQEADSWSFYKIRKVLAERSLVKLDAKTGKVKWYVGMGIEDEEAFENKASFASPPVTWNDNLYVGATELRGTFNAYVVSLDPETGKLRWKTLLGSAQQEQNLFGRQVREAVGGKIAQGEGRLFYLTNLGAVAAVDPNTGRISWIYRYDRIPLAKPKKALFSTRYRDTGWHNSPVIYHNGLLYLAPIDANYLYCLDALTGEQKWKIRRFGSSGRGVAEDNYLLAVSHGKVITGGRKRINIWDAQTGKNLKQIYLVYTEKVTGYGAVIGKHFYCPGSSHVYCIDLEELKVSQKIPWRSSFAGHIVIADSVVVVASKNALSVYHNAFSLERSFRKQIKKSPQNPLLHIKLANLYAQRKGSRLLRSAKLYQKAMRLAKENVSINSQSYLNQAREGLVKVYLKIAQAQERKNNLEVANKYYEKVLQFAQEPQLVISLIFRLKGYYEKTRKYETMREQFTKLIKEYGEEIYRLPDGSEVSVALYANLLLARHYNEVGEYTQAIHLYQKIILEYPEKDFQGMTAYDLAFKEMSEIIAKQGREVYQDYEKIVQNRFHQDLGPDELFSLWQRYPSSHLVPEIVMNLTDELLKREEFARSLEVLRLYIRRYPQTDDIVQAYYLLVETYEKLEAFHAARAILKQLEKNHAQEWIETQDQGRIQVSEYVEQKLAGTSYERISPEYHQELPLWEGEMPKKSFFLPSQDTLMIPPFHGVAAKEYRHLTFLSLSEVLYCYNGQSGALLWKKKLKNFIRGVGFQGKNLFAYDHHHIYSLNPQSGEIKWQRVVENQFVDLQIGRNALALTHYKRGEHSTLKVLEPETGKIRWQTEIQGREPARIELADEVIALYIAISPAKLLLFDLNSGRYLFNHQASLQRSNHRSYFNPLILGGKYFCFVKENTTIECYEISTMKLLWSYEAGEVVRYSLWGNERYVIFLSQQGELTALDLSTGGIKWRWRIPENSRVYRGFPYWDTFYLIEGRKTRFASGPNLWALDATDGTTKWTIPISQSQNDIDFDLAFTDEKIVILNNRWVNGYQSFFSIYQQKNGKLLKSYAVKRGDRGQTRAFMAIVAEQLWLVKDNQVWIFGR